MATKMQKAYTGASRSYGKHKGTKTPRRVNTQRQGKAKRRTADEVLENVLAKLTENDK